MNIKQILFFFCLFMVFISAMSLACATDEVADSTVSISGDDTLIAQATDTHESVLTDDSGSFTQLDDKIQNMPVNGSIKLDKNYTYSTGERVGIDGIVINKDITIDGDGHTIDGANLASIFQITDNANVVLKNIVFANARGTNGSAVIVSSSENVEIINSQFINNSALNGGAIYFASADTSSITSNLKIVGSTFVNNRAVNGGAFYVSGDLFNVTSSTFNHNIATNDGGSIYSDAGGHIEGNVFEYETAGRDGGTMYLNSKLDSSSVDPSVLNNLGLFNNIMSYCSAGRDGGAGFFNATHGTIRNTTFSSSTAKCNGGGAVWLCTNSSIVSTTVFNNTACNDGGGIYLYPPQLSSMYDSAVVIMYSNFANNTANHDGGALYCGGLFSVILNSTFAHDKAYDGAGIYLDVGAAINHCIFDGENAINDGGAIYLNASNTIISGFSPYMQLIIDNVGVRHSVISNCIAGHDGGAGYVFGNRGVVENLTMINNTAGHDGGAGYVVGNYGQLFDSLFINNTAANDGGALLWEGVNGTIKNITVVNNKATNNGGGIALDAASSQGTTSISNSSFKANTADYGGAIYCANMFTNILDSNFAHDEAYYGGGIYLDYGAYIHNSTLFNESAVYDGGGIYLNSSNTKLDSSILQQLLLDNKVGVIDSFILNCTAGRDGGAGYVYGDYGIVNNLTMINNFAGRGGGAGYVYGDYGRLYNSTMINNRAGDDGGALFWQGNGGTVFNLTCKVNYAGDAGGSIFIFGSDLSFTDSSFTLSNASDYGGAIYIYGDNVLINNSLFEKCAVNAYDGGAVYASGSNTTISKCNFIMNRVNIMNGGRGGSINLQGNGAKILDCIFERCTAYEGGVVYINGTNAVLDNLSCIYSFATNGGAFYLNGNNATIFNTKVSFNNATDYGGAIYVAGDFALIDNSNFTKCIVYQYDGGAIYAEGLNATILNSYFGENRVIGNKARGGSMFIQGDYLSLEGCTFNRCTSYEGGVIYINGSNARIEDSSNTFSLAQSGSAIYVAGNNVTICHFNSSYANSTLKGGSIYIEGNDSNIFNSNFLRVHSLLGGAIYISGDNAIVNESTFNYCMGNGTYEGGVGGAGGSIYVEGEDATISGSQFKFSSAANYGGAIYVDGANVNIYGTSYDTCSANAYNGGAIYVKGLNATISDSNFTRNRVNVSNFARGGSIDVFGDDAKILGCMFDYCIAYDGGIIYVNGNNAIIDNSTLTYSSAVNDGGAIYIAGSDATISNSTLNFNNATSYGGAIFVDGANACLDGDVFEYCSSDRLNGGAVYVKGVNTTISNSNFSKNRVNVSNFARGGSVYVAGSDAEILNSTFDYCIAYDGAVLYIDGANAHIDGSEFTHSSAVNDGGAIYVAGSDATISNSVLNFNNATNFGGAIFVDGANAHLDGDVFANCSSDRLNGGAVYVKGVNTTISNSNFTRNRVNIANFALGGAVYVAGSDAKLFNTSFEMCIAYNGAVLYLDGDDAVIDGSTFMYSSAFDDGGAIYVAGNNAVISNSTFTLNNATQNGGAVYVAGNNANIDGTTFFKCSTINMNGGAVYVAGLNTTISNSNFTKNSANGTNARGGSLEIQGSGTKVLGTTFDQCIAYEGGAIYVNGTDAIIDDSSFTRCAARINGGAIYVAGNNAIISGSEFEYNNGTDYGGSIYIEGDNTLIIGDHFERCSVINRYGGALYVAGLNTTIAHSNFTLNSANGTEARGGSIDIQGDDTTISCCNFMKCVAYEGGAIYVNGTNAVIDNSTVTFSLAYANGGAVYVAGENATISNSQMTLNNATDYGGAVYVSGSSALINNTAFTMCAAQNKHGGAIFVAGLNTTISYSNFTQNSANGTGAHGGAIDVSGNDTTIYKCIFDRCSAYDGGTLYIYGECTVIDGMDFKRSIALHDGGTIYILGHDVTISNTSFAYTNASHNGGAVYVAGNNSNIVNSSFTICIAKNGGDGGAIYIAGTNATVEASRFNTTQSAQGKGGAIFIAGDNATVVDSTLVLANSTSGGFMYIEGDNVKVLNSSMMFSYSNIVPNATGLGRGGAIFIAGDNAVISADFKFTNATGSNGKPGNGGALFIAGTNATVINSTFFTTIAKNCGDGGAIYIEGIDATVKESYFDTTQSALGRGGAIYVNGYNANVLNSTFIRANSTAGGFIYIEGARADVLDSSFMFSSSNIIENGTGDGNGGAIYIAGDDAVVSGDFRFINATGGKGIPGHGGSIYVAGNNANITDSTFFGTHARNYGFGGAIYVTGNNTYMNNDTFDNGFAYKAGAVYITGSDATINMSNFVSNNCMDDGGALYITGEYVKVINSNFTRNTAGDDGGAIYWEGNDGLMENITCDDNKAISSTGSSNGGTICLTGNNTNVTKSTFTKTYAFISGGAIFATGNNITISDSAFSDCNVSLDVEETNKTYANGGGALYVLGSDTNVLNCTFENSNGRQGGAVYVQGNDAILDMLIFDSNYASDDGAALYVAGQNGKLYNSNFTNNIAGDDGGAIYWTGNGGDIYNITCFDNHAISTTGSSNGGTLCIIGSNLNLNASSFEQTHALIAGGAIFITGNYVNITDSSFKNCNVAMDIEDTGKNYANGGGSIYVFGNYTNLLNCKFEDTHGREGGAIYVQGNDAVIDELNSTDTYAKEGGSIYVAGVNAKLLNSNLTYSHANDGGAVYVRGDNTLIDSSLFTHNNVSLAPDSLGSGGAIYVRGASTNITHSTFLDSTAYGGDGGSVYIGGYNTNIEYSEFQHSRANEGEGGAIFVAGNLAHVHDSLFNDTQAGDGGAIYIGGFRTGEDAKILNCIITNSQSKDDGGAIYVAGANALISVDVSDSKSLGLKDTTGYGGAIYVGGGDANITQSTFNNCSAGADASGGAIYVEGDYANIEKSKFHNTYANDGELASGGAIAIEGNMAIVSESEFTECFASNGGVLFVEGRRAELRDSNVTDCYAYGYGGAIYILYGEKTVVDGSVFDNCTSINKEGGSIVINGDYTIISNSNFTDCNASSAEGLGGAIYIEGEETTIQNAIFNECISVDGGAVFIQGNDVHISDSAFVANKLKDYTDDDNYGGAIYINGERTIISTSTFEDHSAYTGGSIYINGTDTTILDSNITKSTADYGGAVFIQGINAKIEGGNISYCTCTYDGGAIYVNGTNAHISADFAYCNASSADTPDIIGNGGAIYVNGTDTNVYDSTFLNCIAMNDGNGGAIYIEGVNTLVQTSKFQNTWTSDNAEGGAIYIYGANATVAVSEFITTHSKEGGAIYIYGPNATVDKSKFVDSHAAFGGAIYIEGINTTVTDSGFINTNVGQVCEWGDAHYGDPTGYVAPVEGDGGAIYIYGPNAYIENATIDVSHATRNGGAIYVEGSDATISATIRGSYAGVLETSSNFNVNELTSDVAIINNYYNEMLSFYNWGVGLYSADLSTIKNSANNAKSNNRVDNIFTNRAFNQNNYNVVLGYVLEINSTLSSLNESAPLIYDSLIGYYDNINRSLDEINANKDYNAFNSHIKNDIKNNLTAIVNFVDYCTNFNNDLKNCYNNALKDLLRYNNYNTVNNKLNSLKDYSSKFNTYIVYLNSYNSAFDELLPLNEGFGAQVNLVQTKASMVYDPGMKGEGGAIYVAGVNTFIHDSDISDTHAYTDGDGGAIYVTGTNTSVINSNFTNTIADHVGGAAYIAGHNTYITGDSFYNSKSKGTGNTDGGGAMYIVGDGTYVSDSNFTLSDSSRYGGAIYIAGKNTDILTSNFIQNHAASPGGAVYIQQGLGLNTTVDKCYFFDNSAGTSAGALHVSGTNTTVNNTVFLKNHGVSQGGAIYIDGINATVQYSNLTENTASTHGGAIYWKGGHGGDSIVGCIIFNNSATSYDSALGGGVYWDIGTQVTPGGLVKDTIFDSNYAGKHGGGMDWHRTVNSTMDNCTFINNIAGKDGGGFYCGDTGQFDVSTNLTIINTKFSNNTANYAGGGLSLQMRDSQLINCTFENNIAYFGGSLVIKDTKTTNNQIINCTFINSTASTVLINSTVQAIIDNFNNVEEFCKGKGGAIFTRDNLVSVIGCTFINCTGKEGGAVFWDGGDNYQRDNPSRHTGVMGDDGIIRDSTFIGNNATLGGAICWTSPNGVVTDSTFIGNNATLGGAVYWKGGVEYIEYKWNYVNTFAVHGNNGKVTNSEFIENTATNGGAIYWAGENGNVSNSKFTDNYAEKGGAIYWTNITQNATYPPTRATTYTKIATTGNNGIVENSTFFANKANYETGLGGAIYWNTSSSNITDTTFLNNTASKGGAIYWVNGTKIDNSTFRFNKAHTGSAIYEDASMKEMDIIDSSFLENRADSNTFEQFKITDVNGGVRVSAYYRGNDNIINGMWNDGGEVYFTNVTYLGINANEVNTGSQRVTPEKINDIPTDSNKFYQSDYEVGQIIRISVYDQNGLVAEDIKLTGFDSYVEGFYSGLTAEHTKVKIEHPADDYYTYLGDRDGAQLVYILIDTEDIYCLDDEIINITVVPQNKSETRAPTGNITIKVIGNNGKTYEANITLTVVDGTNSSVAQFNATLCPTGIYSVEVFYHGDDVFFPQDNSSSFRVFEIDPTIIIETENIRVGEMEIINITVDPTKKVTGTVSVYIDSVYIGDLPLVNGTIQIRDSTFPVGVHNVIGIYNGDEHFKLVRNTSSFVVSKYDPYFVIEGRTIFVDDQEYLEIFISNKTESGLVHIPTGFVYLVVEGEQYYINLTTQKGILLPISTEAGVYHVWGNYSGDGFWNSAVNTTDFLVLKHNITLNVTDVVKVYGGEEKINVTFEYDDVTGNVTIRIMDKTQVIKEFKDVPIVKGNATVEISGLNPGNYTIDVVYLGDRKYYGNTTSGNLTVKKGKIPMIIVPHNIIFGEKENIMVYANTTGGVDIYINGTKIGDDYFTRGEAESSKSGLAPGIYNASAYFRGNDYYEPGWVSAPFIVYKLNRTVDLSVEDIIYGMDENLRVFVNASGNVTIWVNGTNKTIVLEVEQFGLIDKGSAKWVLEGLDVGTYPVEVWYNGNEFYNPAYTWGVFQVIPVNTTLTVDVHDIYIWDNESISVTVKDAAGSVITDAPGNITITIEGATYSQKLNNGVARFVIPNLTIGTKNVWAFYDGDKNHNGNRSLASFKVMPRVPVVNVTAQNITVGEVEPLHVEIPANATGFVIITGNFTENGIYVSKFIGGKADIPVYDLASGTYSVHIKYYGGGNDNYTVAEADTVFKVSGEDTPIRIDVKDIYYRQTANITVSVNDGVDGLITIKVVNGSGIIREITLPISNGKVNLLVDNLAVDNYTVYADYLGNNKYHANSTSKVFKVMKIAPVITIDSVETNSIRNATVVVHITPGTTGNVTITVNNKKYNGTIENGVVRIVIDQLNSGNYTVDAYYAGDRNFTEASANKDNAVNIFRYSCYVMNVTAEDTKVDLNTTIIVNVPCDAVGKVAIYINNSFAGYATIENGVAKLNVTKSIYGKYVVNATFMDDKYANKTVTTNYHVFKWETPMIINVTDIYVGDVATIVVSVPANITDNVTIEIAGKKYSAKVINGNATFKVANLTCGNKTVTAIYAGNYKYLFNATTNNFTVYKRPSTVVVNTTDINVGDVAIINVTVPQNATGYVVISVNGTNYTVNVTDGKGSIPVSGLPYGTYDINVTYIGDEQYLPNTNSTTLKVSKVPSNITVAVNNITVGDVAIINMTVPKDATGNITVKVNSTVVVVGIVNGTAQAIVPYLKVGNYTVDVTYNGDGKYLSSVNATKLTVNKASSDITVVDQGNGTVVVIVPGNATGNVTIIVENQTFNGTVINGTAIINLTNVTLGEHNITVIYSGDENHTSEIINATVTIPKLITPIKVDVTNIYVGDVAKINVTVPVNATDKIRIEIDGKEYFATIVDGVARFVIENLTAGVKTVAVSYDGDDNYTANFTTANFTVFKHTPVVTVNTTDIIVGETVVINVIAPVDVTRQVIVNVNGVDYAVNMTNGVGQLNVTGLDNGSYDVTVRYLGDDKYLGADNATGFKVSKLPSTVSTKADNITVGEKAIIEITVIDDATGIVTVTVGGKDYNVSVADGKGILVVPGLKVGNYTVDVKYLGDRKYESSTNATKFTVNKIKSDDITVVDQGNGTVVVVVPGNATGNVTIVVENQTFTGPVVNGTVIINLTNVTPGEHNITVIYSGDENHTSEIINTTVTIPVRVTPIKVDVADIYVGDVAKINVTVPGDATGKIRIEIDGKEYYAEIENGVARFEVENLTAGPKTVAVSYVGDENYEAKFATANFTVFKRNSFVSAEIESIIVGENVIVKVKVPTDATGQVLVDVDGVSQYYVNVTNGEGFVTIPYIPSGKYNVNLTYIGDDKYLPSANVSLFDVNKVKPFVIPIAHDIIVGENEVIKLIVPVDATGNVTVIIDGEEFVFDLNEGTIGAYYSEGEKYIVAISGGNGELVIQGLPVGEYVVSVRYNGDYKYTYADNTTTFKVTSKDTDIKVYDLGNGTVLVIVPENATGNVTIEVENQTFTAPVVNGTAIVDLTNVTPGKHNITVIYSGDENNNPTTENATVNIPGNYIPIDVSVHDIYVGDTEVVVVTLPEDATGTVTIEINAKEYTAPVVDGKAIFYVDGLAFGNKTVAVKYSGDDKCRDNFTTGQFRVIKRPTTITATAQDIYVGFDEVINAHVLPDDATGKVLVDIGGVGYYATIENGVVYVIIPELPSGECTARVTYEGDDKYLPSVTTVKFTVSKLKTPINAAGDEIEEGEEATVVVRVPEDATGTITITVNGEKYTKEVENGKVVFVIPGLVKGDWDVQAEYSGDKKYEANDTITDILVYRNDPSGNETHNDTEGGESARAVSEGIALSKYPTGNPILMILLILIALGAGQARRFKR
ncbi:Ig-like domain repeat protein [Methanobrevibacter millerae]|uniref:Adhesin-like protein n=1 Tax=Methanobrevibacter millerae TaxID=230361 RepID=A0A0U3CDL0_9EURY|nr:Ig-like domain repeat protein [Methanobrevibacter millerae]ALT67915.1 adhesin-like protein [Methanobrevibacter millerae]